MKQVLFEKAWDYSQQASYYKYRPNYPDRAVEILSSYVNAKKTGFSIIDIGAGTGNLTVLLLKRGYKVTAVEPNDAMRAEGTKLTGRHKGVKWVRANGIETTLEGDSANWVTFGSSFNVMDRRLALLETHRLLRPKGFFSCLWNHRDLQDPIQKKIEDIIDDTIPNYERGVRREDQRPLLEEHKHIFRDIFYFELDFEVIRTVDEYIKAWTSVRNKYWDLSTEEGRRVFRNVSEKVKKHLPKRFSIKYTTRAWTAQKTERK